MTDDRKPKRYKNILSWFQLTPPSGSGSCSGSRNGSKHVTSQSVNDVPVDSSPSPSIPIPVVEECHNERNERVEMFDVTSLERDPDIRKPICLHLLNEQDNIRRAYVVLGPYQPKF